MKKIFNATIACAAMSVAAWGLTACSDSFLEEKVDFNNVSPAVYDTYEGARARVNDLYAWCLPDGRKVAGRNGMNMGLDDDMSKSTEEYAGFGKWVDPQKNINTVTGTEAPDDWFHIQLTNIQQGVYGRIRNVNDVIRGIENGALPQAEKDELLGQAYFWRAWCYYMLVKWYGGVPLVTEVLEPVEGNVTPRSSARESFRLIFDDLDKAAEMLKASTAGGGWSSENWGRITTGTAVALKGRVMNLWASPMFNRKNDASRWEEAYRYQSENLALINACGYELVDGSSQNAQGWANLFARTDRNPEAIMLTIRNQETGDNARVSSWEQNIRPTNSNGGGGKQPSNLIIDLFPMKDGKVPANNTAYNSLPKSEIAYDTDCPWMNRDPRFYRTFAFPGVRWTYSGTPTMDYYPTASSYTLWSYVWYTEANKDNIDNKRSGSSQGPDGNTSAKGFYVRKRTSDADAGSSNYTFSEGFSRSATPWIEIRYAEVLLNLAEAAVGANHIDVAVEQLRTLRQRVGYTGDCGIASGMTQQTAMAAVLYERQIELAYEGKRFDDMRRWMLFDGGATQPAGAPGSWSVDGWSGNTCTWLGVAPFNNRRRDYYEFYVKTGFGGTEWNTDPISNGEGGDPRPAGVDLRSDLDTQLETLKAFYAQYLQKKIKSGDDYDSTTDQDRYTQFRPHYYFLGLTNGAQNNNTALPQTIGWEDYLHSGSAGTFDPLAETAE